MTEDREVLASLMIYKTDGFRNEDDGVEFISYELECASVKLSKENLLGVLEDFTADLRADLAAGKVD